MNLPQYRCHKLVRAAKITAIECDVYRDDTGGRGNVLVLDGGMRMGVGDDFFMNRRVDVGGYFVVYEDGYASFSPAKAFEEWYTRIGDKEIPSGFGVEVRPNGDFVVVPD